MATYDLRARPLHSTVNAQTPVKVYSATFDGPDATLKKGSAISTNDIFNLITLPANSLVLAVFAISTTVEGGTCTVTLEDVSGNDFITGMDCNVSATTTANSLSTTTPVCRFYTAADAINLKLITGTAATTVVKVTVAYVEMNPASQ